MLAGVVIDRASHRPGFDSGHNSRNFLRVWVTRPRRCARYRVRPFTERASSIATTVLPAPVAWSSKPIVFPSDLVFVSHCRASRWCSWSSRVAASCFGRKSSNSSKPGMLARNRASCSLTLSGSSASCRSGPLKTRQPSWIRQFLRSRSSSYSTTVILSEW